VEGTEQDIIVRVRGDGGVPESAALGKSILHLSARRPASVTFDLKELRLISSLFIGVLVSYRRGAVRAGTRVCLAPDLQPLVREALQRTGVLGLFETQVSGERPTPAPGLIVEPKLLPRHAERTPSLTWTQLLELEPAIESLLWRARAAGASCRTKADVPRVFSPVAHELAELIGFSGKHRRHRVLGTVEAYQIAYWKLYEGVAACVPRKAAKQTMKASGPGDTHSTAFAYGPSRLPVDR
jgi:anti-anti-sigma regulatory factor